MKKRLFLFLSLVASLFILTACLPFPFNKLHSKESSSSSSSTSQEDKAISQSEFKKLAKVEEKAVKDKEPADPKQKRPSVELSSKWFFQDGRFWQGAGGLALL